MEAIRIGTVFAHNKKAYEKWQRNQHKSRSLSDAALERAIMNLAQTFPDNIIRVPV